MLILSLFWLLIGLLIGALVALLGGLLGTWLLGTLFATASAIWIAVLGVALLPRLATWCYARLHSRSLPGAH